MIVKSIYSTSYPLKGTGLGYISFQTAKQLNKHRSLKKIISETKSSDLKLNKKIELVNINNTVKTVFNKLKLGYYGRRNAFDSLAAKKIEKADIFHGFSHESLSCFGQAKKLGLKCVLDHPNTNVDFQNRLLLDEAKAFNVSFRPYNKLELLKVRKEFEKADLILLLSNLALETFKENGFDEEKLVVNPYGVDSELFKPKKKNGETFRVVFTGQIGLRKGVQYLLDAWAKMKLKDAELILTGWTNPNILSVLEKFKSYQNIKIIKQLDDMNDIARLYQTASICAFPSIEDGWAMTVTEAMASGKPIIVSENTGAKDAITDSKNGFIVPIRNINALKEKIQYYYDNPKETKKMGRKARNKALEFTWEKYGKGLIKAYKEVSA